jgi:hypothetical protein
MPDQTHDPSRPAVDAPTTKVAGPVPPPGPVRQAAGAVERATEQATDRATTDDAGSEARRLAGRRTDEIVRSPAAVRERTLAFSAPEMRHRPIEPVRVGSTPRRWPWVLLTLVPLLVILVSGVAWLVLVQRM